MAPGTRRQPPTHWAMVDLALGARVAPPAILVAATLPNPSLSQAHRRTCRKGVLIPHFCLNMTQARTSRTGFLIPHFCLIMA